MKAVFVWIQIDQDVGQSKGQSLLNYETFYYFLVFNFFLKLCETIKFNFIEINSF